MDRSLAYARFALYALVLLSAASVSLGQSTKTPVSSLDTKPKSAKPSYEETSAWIASKFPQLFGGGEANVFHITVTSKFRSMESCTLQFRDIKREDLVDDKLHPHMTIIDFNVPLIDVGSIDFIGESDSCLRITTNHPSIKANIDTSLSSPRMVNHDYDPPPLTDVVDLCSRNDYDTRQLMTRLLSALRHAAKLCEPPVKSNEPF